MYATPTDRRNRADDGPAAVELLSAVEAADRLGVHPDSVRRALTEMNWSRVVGGHRIILGHELPAVAEAVRRRRARVGRRGHRSRAIAGAVQPGTALAGRAEKNPPGRCNSAEGACDSLPACDRRGERNGPEREARPR